MQVRYEADLRGWGKDQEAVRGVGVYIQAFIHTHTENMLAGGCSVQTSRRAKAGALMGVFQRARAGWE